MKRLLLHSLALLVAFAVGFASALFVSNLRASFAEENFRSSITEMRKRIYGTNYFHNKGAYAEAESHLAAFDLTKTTGSITLSYVGGMDGSIGGSNFHLQLRADGSLYTENHGSRRLITTIPADRCASLFRRVLSSGILNYSAGVVELKKDLLPSVVLRN